ncbi:MAG TPA: signal peptide peptidase SppA [Geminicoccaceae bacterium]|nr:signal peptide peptidase SppA [Geminicoccaceae bacterium]
MKRFVVGLLATIGLLALLLAGGTAAAVWLLLPAKPDLPSQIVLALDLRQGLDEVAATDPLSALGLAAAPTLTEVILALDRAGQDPRVKGLVAQLSGEGPGLAQTQELRAALAGFRAQGKFAYAYADSFGEFGPGTRGYYLATAFEQIHLQPVGSLGLTGFLIETPFLRGLFDKLGIQPSGDKRGVYKTAADMFLEDELTPAHKEALESLADSLDQQIKTGIGEGRALDPALVARLIDDGPYFALEAQQAGLVDRLSYWDEVREQAKEVAGAGSELVGLTDYARALDEVADDASVIALVRGVGQIQRGDSDYGPAGGWVMGGDTVAGAIAAAIDDPEVEAILFRIDSGGGSAVASETIGRQVRRAVEGGKPVVVSMGDVAASGGYWIAMDASKIVAGAGTLTGSIGVFAGKPVLDRLWQEVGVNWGRVQRGANADMWSTGLDFDARGRARLEAFLDRIYEAFVEGVARGRQMAEGDVRKAAEGRVWTGAQARELGLVDDLGGFARALELAREAIGLAPDRPVELRLFPPERTPLEQALELLDGSPIGLDAVRSWLLRRLAAPGVLSTPPLLLR